MRLLVGILLLLFLPGLFLAFLHLGAQLIQTPGIVWPIAIGTALGMLLHGRVLSKIAGLETFEHELTHAIVAVMFFRKIKGFVSTRYQGGAVWHEGGFGGWLGDECIGLAPYVLPTFTFFAAIVRPFVPVTWFPWFDLFIGVTFGYHLLSTWHELHRSWDAQPFQSAGTGEWTQSDIARRGFLYSLVFIVTVTLAIHSVIMVITLNGYHGVSIWGKEVWGVTWASIQILSGWFHWIMQKARGIALN